MLPEIKIKIKKNKRLYFYANILRYWREERFRDYIRGFNGSDVVFLYHPGKLYPELLVYDINFKEQVGFFAIMQWLLASLCYAERFYLTPVIRWTESKFYKERELINGTDNIFEYYYLPVSDVSPSDVFKCKNVVSNAGGQRFAAFENNLVQDVYRKNIELTEKYGKLYRKYCKLNPITQSYIDTNLSETINGKKVLGVHIRGTDFKREKNAHPVYISAKDYIKPVKKIMKIYGYDWVFLATDSLEAVNVFKKEFGKALVFYDDIIRSDGDVGLHYLRSNRENHHYKLGLEVIRDAYTLAACDSLIAGMSNVSLAAQYIKIAEYGKYQKVLNLDYGINSCGKIR